MPLGNRVAAEISRPRTDPHTVMKKAILLGAMLSVFSALGQTNDTCSTVTPVPLAIGESVVFNGDNTGATINLDYQPGSILAGLGVPSTWHAFTITSCADLTISYCGTSPAFTEYWNVLATTCPASNALVVTQQYNTTVCGDGNPTIYFLDAQPATYYFPVWYQDPGANGPYTISVSAVACGGSGAPNDNCSAVTPEALGVGGVLTFSGDNTTATATGDFAQGSPFAGAPAVWHAFTLDACTSVSVAYCGQVPAWGNTLGILARDCPASDLVYFSTFNTDDCGDGNRTYFFDGLLAGTYYIPVLLHPASGSVGPYTITVTGSECPPAPTYQDQCTQVEYQPLAVGGSLAFMGDNSSATSTGDFVAGSPFAAAPVIWHGFTTTQCARVTVAYCGQAPTWDNTLGFLSRDCPASDLVFFSNFNDSDCGDGNRTYIFSNLPAGNYLVPILRDEASNAIGEYTVTVSATSCPATPPANDNCADITAVQLDAGATVIVTGDNTNATSTGDFVPGSPFAAAPVTWHAFTIDACTDLVVSYCGQDPAWSNTLGVLATTCPGDALIYFTAVTPDCGDGNTSYIFNDLQAGTYYLPVLRDAGNNSFGPYSISVTAEDCLFLGMAPAVVDSPLRIWPNPSDGNIVVTGLSRDAVAIRVMDASGRMVHAARPQAPSMRLDIGGQLASGAYLLQVIYPDRRNEQRFMVH